MEECWSIVVITKELCMCAKRLQAINDSCLKSLFDKPEEFLLPLTEDWVVFVGRIAGKFN